MYFVIFLPQIVTLYNNRVRLLYTQYKDGRRHCLLGEFSVCLFLVSQHPRGFISLCAEFFLRGSWRFSFLEKPVIFRLLWPEWSQRLKTGILYQYISQRDTLFSLESVSPARTRGSGDQKNKWLFFAWFQIPDDPKFGKETSEKKGYYISL